MSNSARYDSNRVRLQTGEYQRKNGWYEYRYSVFGKEFSFYDKTLEGLREKKAEILSTVQETHRKYDSRVTTVNDFYELWKEMKRGLRENTFRNYCYMYDTYVKGTFGRLYVYSVKKSDVKRFLNMLVDERRLSAHTADAVHTVLHQVLQIAVDDEIISSNPSDRAMSELLRAHNRQYEKRRTLTVPQEKLLREFLKGNSSNTRWEPITIVMLETGMRVGEVTGLRWCDIHYEENYIDVNHTLVYYSKGEHSCEFAINDTKTPAGKRKIPMTDSVKEALRKEREMQQQIDVVCNMEIDGYTDFIFLNRFGGVYHQGTLNKAYKRIIRDCNDAEFLKSESPEVLVPNFSCHNLRHTFATRLCESGMNLKATQYLLGHTDVSTTMDIYTSVSDEFLMSEFDKLNFK